MKTISQINFRGIDINFMETNDEVGYSFGFEGRNYGQKVKVSKPTTAKTRQAYMEAIVALLINAVESYEQLKNDSNKTTRGRTKGSKSASSNKRKSK